jgi:hypothetical protein
MIAPPKPPAQDELELLIKEARERQLRRRLLGAAGVAITAAVALAVYAVTIGHPAGSGPAPARAAQAAAPLCKSSQLSTSTFFQGATQTMLGGVTLRNTGGVACSLPDARPAARISWEGRWLPTREIPMATPAPSIMSPAHVLGPGKRATVYWQWWSCGGPGPRAAVRPGFQLTFGHGLIVIARSADATPPFCGGLGGTRNLDVSRPLIES